MKDNQFQMLSPKILGNTALRDPQVEAYEQLELVHAITDPQDREYGIILPVGCGKSGLITLAPFALKAKRALVIAPFVKLADQLYKDFHPSTGEMFYLKTGVLDSPPYPEPVRIQGTTTNIADVEEGDIVITNIGQLQRENNRWLAQFPNDFFDLIIFDEAHHNVADSWDTLRNKFPEAKIVNLTATPQRADGQLMSGRIIYSYPIFKAIEKGYVKRLTGKILEPSTLKYVREEDGKEIEVTLEQVIQLGEDDSDFRRSIVTSAETLSTIVNASIRELRRLRTETGEQRLKIIASALNYKHCLQIVEAYRALGLRAGYVHSREDSKKNDQVFTKLENHELDVIVQVRKLGEGFDHKYLSVAAVFSVFSSLSPFVQFVGRVMRAIAQGDPTNPINHGTVVFHAGANIASKWRDFQNFSTADQDYFNQLLPLEGWSFDDGNELNVEPHMPHPKSPNMVVVTEQDGVRVVELPLLRDARAKEAFKTLLSLGYTHEDYKKAEILTNMVPTKADQRAASRAWLDETVQVETGRLLGQYKVNPGGKQLSKNRNNQNDYTFVKAHIDKKLCALVGRNTGERSEWTRPQLDMAKTKLDAILDEVEKELFSGLSKIDA